MLNVNEDTAPFWIYQPADTRDLAEERDRWQRHLQNYATGVTGDSGTDPRTDLAAIVAGQRTRLDDLAGSTCDPHVLEQIALVRSQVAALGRSLDDACTLWEIAYRRGRASVQPGTADTTDVPEALVYATRAPHSSRPVDAAVVVNGKPCVVGGIEPGADPARLWAYVRAACA